MNRLPPSLPPAHHAPASLPAVAAAKAQELEGVLLGQFVQLLFQGVGEDGMLGGGSAAAQWKDVLAQEYGKAIAESGGIGLAVQIERELAAAMGAATNPPAGAPPAPGPDREQP
jgi:hypothetical protein